MFVINALFRSPKAEEVKSTAESNEEQEQQIDGETEEDNKMEEETVESDHSSESESIESEVESDEDLLESVASGTKLYQMLEYLAD